MCNAQVLKANRLSYTRLDGSVAANKRQERVDAFNHSPDVFAFLLSSKAGGCGINLIGANRLVLFDPDWNPAVDQQALARVWRSGQQRPCYVYRFFAVGTLEEVCYDRQCSKEGLAGEIVDGDGGEPPEPARRPPCPPLRPAPPGHTRAVPRVPADRARRCECRRRVAQVFGG